MQRGQSPASRLVHQGGAVQVQQVEEECGEGDLASRPLDVEALAETTHRCLKWMGSTILPKRDHLAVEDELTGGQGTNQLHHLGHRGCHLVEPAGVDRHLVAALVDLDPRAVQLVLQRRLP